MRARRIRADDVWVTSNRRWGGGGRGGDSSGEARLVVDGAEKLG